MDYKQFICMIFSGNKNAQPDANGIIKTKLSEGENKFGVYVCGYKNDKSDNHDDFQWFTVTYEPEDSSDNPDNPNTCPGIPTVIYSRNNIQHSTNWRSMLVKRKFKCRYYDCYKYRQ